MGVWGAGRSWSSWIRARRTSRAVCCSPRATWHCARESTAASTISASAGLWVDEIASSRNHVSSRSHPSSPAGKSRSSVRIRPAPADSCPGHGAGTRVARRGLLEGKTRGGIVCAQVHLSETTPGGHASRVRCRRPLQELQCCIRVATSEYGVGLQKEQVTADRVDLESRLEAGFGSPDVFVEDPDRGGEPTVEALVKWLEPSRSESLPRVPAAEQRSALFAWCECPAIGLCGSICEDDHVPGGLGCRSQRRRSADPERATEEDGTVPAFEEFCEGRRHGLPDRVHRPCKGVCTRGRPELVDIRPVAVDHAEEGMEGVDGWLHGAPERKDGPST